ncbi:MAG: hypothetical protein QXT33_04425 [Thermofilum sp.]|uniref:Brix domain-containing protein n=1 Tax=Thermofilum pendens TaxID=2269 RepID=A0A7C4H4D9_THEPE
MYEIVISTTRHVTPPVRRLARELSYALWSAKRVNRGGSSFSELILRARSLGARRLIIVGRGLHGNPGRIVFFDIGGTQTRPLLLLRLRGVAFPEKLRSIRRPSARILVVSVGRCSEESEGIAEDIAYAVNSSYLGCLDEKDLKTFREARVLVVEHVLEEHLAYVLKFIDNSQEIGLKILVKSTKVYY